MYAGNCHEGSVQATSRDGVWDNHTTELRRHSLKYPQTFPDAQVSGRGAVYWKRATRTGPRGGCHEEAALSRTVVDNNESGWCLSLA